MLLVHNEDQNSSAINEVFSNIIREKTIETLPYTLKRPSKLKSIYGNTIQDGTPTPENPVEVQGCGVRTRNIANLYGVNKKALNLTFTEGNNMTIKINGTKVDGANVVSVSYPNIMLHAGTYTVKIKMIGGSITNITGGVMFGINGSTYDMRTAPQVNTIGQIGTRTFTLNEDTLLTSLNITPSYGDTGAVFNDAEFECWLYSGSDVISYEPYGYKIPVTISNSTNSVTTPIYIGSEPLHKIGGYADYIDFERGVVVRNIKKLVLTGKEAWWTSGTYLGAIYAYHSQFPGIKPLTPIFCTHLVNAYGDLYAQGTCKNDANSVGMWIFDTTTSPTAFKSYLATQYEAGTPVTVWYVLAEPEEELITISDITLHRNYNISTDTNIPPSSINIEMPQEIKEIRDDNGNLVYKNWNTIQGTPPIVFKGYNKSLKNYKIYGNTVQNGTPSSEAPVDVVGCGVRTRNVMPAGTKTTVEINGVTFSSDGNGRYHISGTASEDTIAWFDLVSGFTTPTSVSNGGQGTLSFFNSQSSGDVRFNFCKGFTKISHWVMDPSNRTHTAYIAVGDKYIDRIALSVYRSGETLDMTITPEFTDDGILPSCYEPYGYKIPVTISNGVFLDEPLRGIGDYKDTLDLSTGVVTRRIKKRVLTGNENWSGTAKFRIGLSGQIGTIAPICTHYRGATTASYGDLADGRVTVNGGIGLTLSIYDIVNQSSLTVWKSYLATQYEAGTPVIVWYALAEPKIETVSVPSGLSGIIEGYCIQDGTPTPENPIEVVSNGTVQSDGTYLVPRTAQSITTPIYIGSEPLHKIGGYADYIDFERGVVVRNIKKLVLTGKEARWQIWNGNYFTSVIDQKGAINTLRCTHFINSSSQGISYNTTASSALKIASVAVPFVTSVNDLKSYLATQYEAGTPVTVWYVLAEPEETPLSDLNPITPLKGTNTLSTNTTVQSSEVYLKGKIKSLATHMLVDSSGNVLLTSNNYQLVTKEE